VLVTASTVFCFAVQGLSASIAPQLFPSTDPPSGADEKAQRKHKLAEREKRADFAIRVVAFIHASVASVLCLHAILYAPKSVFENVYALYPAAELIFSLSTGYFLWDTLTCIFGGWGIGFIAHGIACTFVYASALYPFLHYWGLFFLLYELSTPFLHARWMALQFGMHKSSPRLFAVIQYTFVIAFVLVRLVAGSYSSYFWWCEMLSLLNGSYRAGGIGPIIPNHSSLVVYTYLLANIILNGLNWFWFSQIIAVKSGKPSTVAKENVITEAAAAATGETAVPDTTSPTRKATKKAE